MTIAQHIKDICPERHPQSYKKTGFTFANEENEEEFLYKCDDCNARVWILIN